MGGGGGRPRQKTEVENRGGRGRVGEVGVGGRGGETSKS